MENALVTNEHGEVTAIIDNETGAQIPTEDAWLSKERIVQHRNNIEGECLRLGEELYWFNKDKKYKALGCDTFKVFLGDPDVDFSQSTAKKLMGIYETFVMWLEVYPDTLLKTGWTKLDMVRPYVSEYNVDELVAQATALSRSDLKIWLQDEFGPQPVPLPPGVYNVIYADPPWQYDNSGFSTSAEQHYPVMPTEDLCDLDIETRAADNAVLFMWATNPLLMDALQVMGAWGFNYKTNLVWVKNKAVAGFYVRGQHELLLIGIRGSCLPTLEPRPVSVIQANVGEHSAKPHSVYELIETMYPGSTYLELFARNTRKGWQSYGNELNGNGNT